MVFSLLLCVIVKLFKAKVELSSVHIWTEEEVESIVHFWLLILCV
jgi:hypothetical protein